MFHIGISCIYERHWETVGAVDNLYILAGKMFETLMDVFDKRFYIEGVIRPSIDDSQGHLGAGKIHDPFEFGD